MGGILLVQYPAYNARMVSLAHNSGKKIVAFVHDLKSLREKTVSESLEYSRLEKFDALIVLTERMKKWFISKGYEKPITTIEMWDYLSDERNVKTNAIDKYERNVVAFAGNIEKSHFLQELHTIDINLNLYGQCDETRKKSICNGRIKYQGVYTPDELCSRMCGGWGLVWDGISVDKLAGNYGEYQKINIPHKAGLYLAAGKPLIVSTEAAIAEYVCKKNIGICVDSIRSLQEKLQAVSDDEYGRMLAAVARERLAIVSGEHIKTATNTVLELLN